MSHIRSLDPEADLTAVAAFYEEAGDYWHLADRKPPDQQKARDFFTDAPPGCDPARSQRLGLFIDGRLCGVAELSFGFPEPDDAYLGLMLLAPRLRGQGYGHRLTAEIVARARAAGSPRLFLAVLDANPRGRAFWEREGFRDTGVFRQDDETGHVIRRMVRLLTATSAETG